MVELLASSGNVQDTAAYGLATNVPRHSEQMR